MFILAVLSFSEAKPRNSSIVEYEEKDELRLADFNERLRFVRGELHYDADYIRGTGLSHERQGARLLQPPRQTLLSNASLSGHMDRTHGVLSNQPLNHLLFERFP